MYKIRNKIWLSSFSVNLLLLISAFIFALPLQANAYSVYGNVMASTYGGETIDRSSYPGAVTSLADSASPSIGDGGTSAASTYFADLSTGLLGTYVSGSNPYPEGVTGASAEAMVSFQDSLTFNIPAGTYESDLYVNANGFVNGILTAFGCNGAISTEICANVYETYLFSFGQDALASGRLDTDPYNSPNVISENFTLSTRILFAGTYLTDQTGYASISGSLKGKGSTKGRFYPPPTGDSSSSFVADFDNTGGFSSLDVPDGVTWTSDSGVFLSNVPIVPEPVSSTLFIVGAAALGFRRFKKRVS